MAAKMQNGEEKRVLESDYSVSTREGRTRIEIALRFLTKAGQE